MNYFYGFANIFRLYLAGVVFSKMAFELGHRGHLKICTGAISYSFCYWGLINAVRHPYFLNPLIYMPLLMIGVDRARKKDKYCVFMMAVALSAVSNIYFSSGKVKSLLYKTASAQDVSGRHDFIVNIGYSSEPIEYVKYISLKKEFIRWMRLMYITYLLTNMKTW